MQRLPTTKDLSGGPRANKLRPVFHLDPQLVDEALRRCVGRPAISSIVMGTMFAKVRGGMAPTADLAHASTFSGPLEDFNLEDFDAAADAALGWRTEMRRAVTDVVCEHGYDFEDEAIFSVARGWALK